MTYNPLLQHVLQMFEPKSPSLCAMVDEITKFDVHQGEKSELAWVRFEKLIKKIGELR